MEKKKINKRIKNSGAVKLKPKISGTRKKDASLIADHIVEATGKGKPIKRFFLVRWFTYIGNKYNEFVNKMFGM